MTADLLVNVAGVSRSFGEVQALTNLTIEVPKGSISVLLGPNGAGKTTAIRMITGALEPDSGTVSVFGADPGSTEGEMIRRRCGVVSAKPSLYDRLSGWDNLRYAAELYGLGKAKKADNRILEAADQFGIDSALKHEVGGYSTGMKTRLALSRAVLHKPDLLLLDEPTSGLDPESANAVLDLIREMTTEGQTVLMCTHLLLEAEGLADEVVMMEHGTSLIWGSPSELSKRYWPTPSVRISAEQPESLDVLARSDGVVGYERSNDTANVEIASIELIPALVSQLAESGTRITSVVPFNPSLEDLYFAVRNERSTPVNGASSPPAPGSVPRSQELIGAAR
jgi:ABC-2 type transport system ATP-binding protein